MRPVRAGNYVGLGRRVPAIDWAELSRIAPRHAGDLAFRMFCVPRFSEYRSADHVALVGRARYHLRSARCRMLSTGVGDVMTYELLPDGDVRGHVMVVHGWTSEASFMTAIAEPLRRSGFRVVLADCPAHGRSLGEHTNLVACAQAMVQVADHHGPFDALVAHSMGALASLMAGVGDPPLPHAVVFKKYCLIAAPNRFGEVTRRFASRLGISDAARKHFERHIERVAHMAIDDFCGERFLRKIGQPTLVVHARDDHEVPFHNAEQLAAAGRHVTLLAFDGLGHRRVLYAPPVVRAAVSFLRSSDGD